MFECISSEKIVPKPNEQGDDACAHQRYEDCFLAVLCDGVGSAKRGGVAARQCVKFFVDQFAQRPKAWDIPKTMEAFTRHINKLLYKESMSQYQNLELLTTLTLALIEGERLYTLNLGDSRIYLLSGGILQQLSTDHVLEEGSHVLTQACGLSESLSLSLRSTPIMAGDTLVLCSDGVSNVLDPVLLSQLLEKGLGASMIIDHALGMIAPELRDDMSLIVARITQVDTQSHLKTLSLPIPEALHEGEIIDGYQLQTPLMAHRRIWKVLREGSYYVMKFPLAEDEESLDTFVQEAWYAKQISHRAFGNAWIPEHRSMRYYLMELIEGENLAQYLKHRVLGVEDAITLGKFLHRAQAHLLHLGLVHGDIKPENIIVLPKEQGLEFKMVDFGSIVEIFSIYSRAGTPTFLAPERFGGGAISEASEIFAMGVTLYWALCGVYPYGEIEPFQTPVFKSPKRPQYHNRNIPAWLDSVILRAIAVDTRVRYEHYSEFFYELKFPDRVQPFFPPHAPLIERSPVRFYQIAFGLALVAQVLTFIFCMSQ